MANIHTTNIIKNLTDEELNEIVQSLTNTSWEEDHILRKVTCKCYKVGLGEEDVMQMLSLAVPIAIELNKRYQND